MKPIRTVLALLIISCAGCIPVPAKHVHLVENRVKKHQPLLTSGDDDGYSQFTQILYSPNGQMVFLGKYRPTIWRIGIVHSFACLDDTVVEAANAVWSHDSRWIAACCLPRANFSDRSHWFIKVWDADSGKETWSIPTSYVAFIEFSSDDSELRLTAVSGDESKRVYSTTSCALPWARSAPMDSGSLQGQRVDTPASAVERINRPSTVRIPPIDREWPVDMPIHAYSLDGRFGYLVADSAYDLLAPWKPYMVAMRYGTYDGVYPGHKVALYKVDLSNGQVETKWNFTVAHRDNWEVILNRDIVMGTSSIAISPNGDLAALGTANGIHVINLLTNKDLGQLLYPLREWEREASIAAVSFSPDGKQIAGTTGQRAFVWNLPQ